MSGLNNVDIGFDIPSVPAWLSTLDGYAHSAIASASTLAGTLNNFYEPYINPNITFTPTTVNVNLAAVDQPIIPKYTSSNKVAPSSPSLITPTLDIISAPTFTELSPEINLPLLPDPLGLHLPALDYSINTNFVYPDDPTYTLPSVPTLIELGIPISQSIAIPIFDLGFPTSNSITIPDITFSFNEVAYSDELLTDVKSVLIRRLQGGTGFTPAIEDAIWSRSRDREQKASLQAERTLLVEQSSTGFSRPTGATISALTQIVQETQSKIIDLSRDIMIKQAELEQENLKNTIQQTIALEDILVRQYNNVYQRSFEVAKYVQDITVEVFKSRIALYNSQVAAYQAFATAYSARVQAELTKVEIFKAQIDAEKLKNEINQQNINLYLAQIEGIKANVDIYKTIVATVTQKLEAEKLKVDIYKTEVEAYGEAVKSKAIEYTMYTEQIKGEMSKVDIYDSKVKTFATRIQAYAAQSDTAIKRASVGVDIEELNIKKYEADLDSFTKQVQADQLIYQSAVDTYKGQAEMYLANVGFNRASSELAIKNIDSIIQQNNYAANISLENAKINLASMNASYSATIEARKAAGNMYTTIGSSALQAINVSAQVSCESGVSGNEYHSYTDQ